MKQLYLTQGKIALIDGDVYEWAQHYKWTYRCRYVMRTFKADHGLRGTMFLHHAIMGYPVNRSLRVDHRNGDRLDNRRENLRIVTQRVNATNLQIHRNGRLSGCHMIKTSTTKVRWRSHAKINGKLVNFGSFATEQEAHDMYVSQLKERGLN